MRLCYEEWRIVRVWINYMDIVVRLQTILTNKYMNDTIGYIHIYWYKLTKTGAGWVEMKQKTTTYSSWEPKFLYPMNNRVDHMKLWILESPFRILLTGLNLWTKLKKQYYVNSLYLQWSFWILNHQALVV